VLRYSLSEREVGVEVRERRFAVLQEVNGVTKRNADHIMLLKTRMRLRSKYKFDRCKVRCACRKKKLQNTQIKCL
jgi:hypothetical protein